jgi:hypothetical protein
MRQCKNGTNCCSNLYDLSQVSLRNEPAVEVGMRRRHAALAVFLVVGGSAGGDAGTGLLAQGLADRGYPAWRLRTSVRPSCPPTLVADTEPGVPFPSGAVDTEDLGGTVQADAMARLDAWPKVLAFLGNGAA